MKANLKDVLNDDLLVNQVITAGLETIINQALRLNLNKTSAFQTIFHKTLVLDLVELPFIIAITLVSKGNNDLEAKISTSAEHSDCTIHTSFNTLEKIKEKQSLTQLIKQGELDVIGDINIAQQYAAIAQSLKIDWRSELAKHIGDVPTHHFLATGKKISKAVVKMTKNIEADLGEYLVHEKQLVVPNSQVKKFNQQVTAASQEVDAIALKIAKLAQRFES